MTVIIYGNASFCCTYNGTTFLPTWTINNTDHPTRNLPPAYELIIVEGELGFCLFIRNVTLEYNYSSYQCRVSDIIVSSIGVLLVTGKIYVFLNI